MKTKDILKLAEDPRFIPGIYNYCDRWCERCAFTSRCLTYAMCQEDEQDPALQDVRNEAFWRRLHEIFQQTREMIVALAEEQGIDLETLDVETAVAENRRRMQEAQAHELSQAARHYAELVDQWFDAEWIPLAPPDVGQNRAREDPASPDEADSIQDAVEIVRWYQYQIGVKIMRALTRSETEEPEAELDWQKGSDGSIKVALIGMDRSLMAWGKLLNYFPEKAESIQPLLFHLERLRRRTEHAFPRARDFIRPGFDTMPSRYLN